MNKLRLIKLIQVGDSISKKMRAFILIISLIIVSSNLLIAQTIGFPENTEKIRVYKGDTIIISVDTAFVIDKNRAKTLNAELDRLEKVIGLYKNALAYNAVLIDNLEGIKKKLIKLSERMDQDSLNTSRRFDSILLDLGVALTELESNNESLTKTNEDLNKQIIDLEKIVKNLKKENRWVWWNGLVDKVVVVAGGIGIGLLIGLAI